MARDEDAVLEAAGLCALNSSKRAGHGRSTSEHWTCRPSAAAGLDFALPPDNAEHNAARIGLKNLEAESHSLSRFSIKTEVARSFGP